MADRKRYYWLKLKDDFFDDETIKFIEEQENGIIYSNFYLKLCLKSVRTEGKLIRVVGSRLIPYDVKSIARLTDVPIDTVAVAMRLFEEIGLVERLDSGEIYLSQINEMIGSETDKAVLMRRKRALDRANLGNDVTAALPECYTENRDKSLEFRVKKLEKEGEEETADKPPAPPRQSVPYEQVKTLYNDICTSLPKCKVLSDARKKAIKARFNSGYGLDDFKTLFEKAQSSSFLTGRNDRNWTASFDWLLKDNNMVKTLDGNYDDHAGEPSRGPGGGHGTRQAEAWDDLPDGFLG